MRYHVIVRDWNNNDGLIVFFFSIFERFFVHGIEKRIFLFFSFFLFYFPLFFCSRFFTFVVYARVVKRLS